jgi:hypothetical protein
MLERLSTNPFWRKERFILLYRINHFIIINYIQIVFIPSYVGLIIFILLWIPSRLLDRIALLIGNLFF